MFILKIRDGNNVRRTRLESLEWSILTTTITSLIPTSTDFCLTCNRPVSGLQLSCQEDLLKVQEILEKHGDNIIDVSVQVIEEKPCTMILKELLSIQTNKLFAVNKVSDLLRTKPNLTFQEFVGDSVDQFLKKDMEDIFNQAKGKMATRTAFKLVYVTEGGKQNLKPCPAPEWINYSTANLEDLSKSLPPSVIESLNVRKKSWNT